jgi:N-acetylmuramoyl-L-alanine amidase
MSLKLIEHPSPNWNARRGGHPPDMIVIHYTGMRSARAAIERLCDPASKVSSHYLIDREGAVLRHVPEDVRAWHAGVSSWHGEADINSRSIGIELVNPGHAHGYLEFPEAQMRALLKLLGAIRKRHAIPPAHVLAHSDVAPARKQDPGERFDWRRLASEGLGLWVEPTPFGGGTVLELGASGARVETLQRDLAKLGYGLIATGQFDDATRQVIGAFQRHWRQGLVDGRADASTHETIQRLMAARP